MKIKTSNLTDAALDHAVHVALHGSCEGYPEHKYSEDWKQGGPIIERERIGVEPWGADATWMAQTYNEAGRVLQRQYGPTPLIATMRCFVASKLGDEVEIPEELT